MLVNSNAGLSLVQQIALDVVVPPIVTAVWWLMSSGWSNMMQGGEPTPRTKIWLSKGFWIVLGLLYLLMFGITLYAHFASLLSKVTSESVLWTG